MRDSCKGSCARLACATPGSSAAHVRRQSCGIFPRFVANVREFEHSTGFGARLMHERDRVEASRSSSATLDIAPSRRRSGCSDCTALAALAVLAMTPAVTSFAWEAGGGGVVCLIAPQFMLWLAPPPPLPPAAQKLMRLLCFCRSPGSPAASGLKPSKPSKSSGAVIGGCLGQLLDNGSF